MTSKLAAAGAPGTPPPGLLPDWLGRLLRAKAAPVPWARALRAGLAVGAPVAGGTIGGDPAIGLLIAIGALVCTVTADRGGSYRSRAARISLSGLGATAGVVVGTLVRGHGWAAVSAIVAMAGFSALLSSLAGLLTGPALTFLVLGVIAVGTAFPRPWWLPAALLGAGAGWTLLLSLAGALRGRGATPEREAVAAVYSRVAKLLGAAGTPGGEEARQELTAALDSAEDTLFTLRLHAAGRDRAADRLMVALDAAGGLVEAAVAALSRGVPAAPAVTHEVSQLAEELRRGRVAGPATVAMPAPTVPEPPGSPGYALAQSRAALSRPGPSRRRLPVQPHAGPARPASQPGAAGGPRRSPLGRLEQVLPGPLVWLATIRLMVCMGAAEALSLELPLPHTYWIALTVAIVVQPDFGSVFARAVQRGLGTVVGVLLGAAVLAVVPRGLPIVAVLALLAAAMPIAIQRNYGMFATVLTPLVVILIAMLAGHPDQVALARVEDTLIGCGVVLVLGYALWPGTWRPALASAVAQAIELVAEYADAAAGNGPTPGDASLATLRRRSYRELSNVRTRLQQLLAEPPPVSRQAARWWPAVVALERLADAVTAAYNGPSSPAERPGADLHGPDDNPGPVALTCLRDDLHELAQAARTGRSPTSGPLTELDALPGAPVEVAALRALLTQRAGPTA